MDGAEVLSSVFIVLPKPILLARAECITAVCNHTYQREMKQSSSDPSTTTNFINVLIRMAKEMPFVVQRDHGYTLHRNAKKAEPLRFIDDSGREAWKPFSKLEGLTFRRAYGVSPTVPSDETDTAE